MISNLQRYIDAQEKDYEKALFELKQGHKNSHWMWYIFPQIHGLGHSSTSNYYAIKNVEEARDYINNEYLFNNLIDICEELLNLKTNNPIEIFGEIDALKLKSSMTLFNYICNLDKRQIDIFSKIIGKYFNNEYDLKTINIIQDDIYNI